jgi:hypothetical protein
MTTCTRCGRHIELDWNGRLVHVISQNVLCDPDNIDDARIATAEVSPMTTTPEARIAEALKPHRYGGRRMAFSVGEMLDYCICGVNCHGGHIAHQAAVIAALPDIAIVELPKPDGEREWCSGRSRNAVWINEDGLIEDRFGLGQDPADVRAWAADLLAAARVAGGGK